MPAHPGFHHVTAAELTWRTELGGHPDYVELFWLDAELDNGWQVGLGLYRSRPHHGGRPGITVNVLRPGLPPLEQHVDLAPEAFEPAAGGDFGGAWAGAGTLGGTLDTEGRPTTYRVQLTAGSVEVDLRGTVVCPGVKFTDAEPGYTHHRPETGTAVGWWPIAPRAELRGSVTVEGERVDGAGRAHLEKQLSSLPLAGLEGEPSAQSMWTWGHFSAGEYTAIWTDSAASQHLGYRHFSPFVLYRGAEPVLSTFAFSSTVERFVLDRASGLPRPAVVTLRATEGDRHLFARLVDGRVSDQFELNGVPGAFYCRQVGRIEGEFRHWGRERLEGSCVHEWGTQDGNLPFRRA